MAWTTPRTWATNELVTASLMNEQLRDNMNALYSPNYNSVKTNTSGSTTSATFVSLASLSLTTSGRRCLLFFSGNLYRTGANVADLAYAAFFLDGAQCSPTYFINHANNSQISSMIEIADPSAGAHTFDFRYSKGYATQTFYSQYNFIVTEIA